MNMIALKTGKATAVSSTPRATVVALSIKATPRAGRLLTGLTDVAARVIPPALVIAVLLVVWEMLCARKGSSLPPPSRVLADTWELIVDPFFDRGGIDKGLFWHLSASLQRVALGYALAAAVGVALGTLIGQSVWALRGLDPAVPGAAHRAAAGLAAPLAGRLPRWATVRHLRHLHHLDLAHHHQHRRRHPQHPAGLSQRRRRAAAQCAGVLH